jgi:hypothetical protein
LSRSSPPIARGLEKLVAQARWATSHWPRRPELDRPGASTTTWERFRRSGGFSGNIHDAFRRRLTSSGKAICGLWFAALVVSRVPGRSTADVAFAVLSSALVVAWLLSWRRPRVVGTWNAPDSLVLGERAEIEVVVRNAGPMPVSDPGAWFFRVSDGLELDGDGAYVSSLESSGSARLRIPVVPRLRGPARLEPPHLLAVEPLGLMRSSRALREDGLVNVRPSRPRLLDFPFLVSGMSGTAFAAALDGSDARLGDPSGVREYRQGDSLRDLHHRSWARRGKPVTRERTSRRGDGIRLVVSTSTSDGSQKVLVDDLLSLASSVASWLETRGSLGEAWLDGKACAEGAEAFWEACGAVPRAGWGRWRPPEPGPEADAADVPCLHLGLRDDRPVPAGAKRILLDWSTESVDVDPSGTILRVSPIVVRARELRL